MVIKILKKSYQPATSTCMHAPQSTVGMIASLAILNPAAKQFPKKCQGAASFPHAERAPAFILLNVIYFANNHI